MFLGHFGAAFAARGVAPHRRAAWPSLGTLILAAQWPDLIWPVFLLTGIERVRIEPGLMEASALDFVHYPYSHSLLATLLWAVAAGSVYALLRRNPAGAVLVGGLVLSHWLLDAPMHRPDLPLYPGSAVLVGAGLWDSIPLTLVLEVGLLAIGLIVYARATRATRRSGAWGPWAMAILLGVVWIGGIFGPPPPGEEAIAFSALSLWVFVVWGYWIDRGRVVRSAPGH